MISSLVLLAALNPLKVVRHHPIVTLAVMEAALSVADIKRSQHLRIIRPVNWHENNPLFGSHPSKARFYGTELGLSLSADILAYKLKKWHHRLWYTPIVAGMATDVAGMAATAGH